MCFINSLVLVISTCAAQIHNPRKVCACSVNMLILIVCGSYLAKKMVVIFLGGRT